MGSGWGYEYEYRFLVDEDIIHRYSRLGFTIRDDIKILFEMRTNFILKDPVSDSDEIIIGSERFEMGAETSDPKTLNSLFDMRLEDYWFIEEEMRHFATQAGAFADETEAMHTGGLVTPIAIEMSVRTVREDSETLAEAHDRAIVSEKMFPLSLMYNRNAFADVETSPHKKLSLFLRGPDLDEIDRVCPRDTADLLKYCKSVSMEKRCCSVCGGAPKVAEQIVILKGFCGHAFHYHCFIHCMLNHTTCPRCSFSLSAAVEDQDYYSTTIFDLV